MNRDIFDLTELVCVKTGGAVAFSPGYEAVLLNEGMPEVESTEFC